MAPAGQWGRCVALAAVLTSLTALLHVRRCVMQDGCPPDVWLQVLEQCADDEDADPTCQCTVVRSLALQLAEQRALTAQLQQQLATQAQVGAEQAARNAAREGQLQQLP